MANVISHPSFDRPTVVNRRGAGRYPKAVTFLRTYEIDKGVAKLSKAAEAAEPAMSAEVQSMMRTYKLACAERDRKNAAIKAGDHADLIQEVSELYNAIATTLSDVSDLKRKMIERFAQTAKHNTEVQS